MKQQFRIFAVAAVVLTVAGCSRRGNPVAPSGEDFPPDSKFSVTLYSPSSSVSNGESFEVRVVLYNVSNVFGAAVEVSYPAAMVEVLGVTGGITFFPPDSVISLSKIESDSGRVDYAVTFKNAASGKSKSGSGIVCTLMCRANATGTASFAINRKTLQISTPGGTLINGFADLLIEDLSMNIR